MHPLRHDIALAFLVAGVAVVLASCLAVLAFRRALERVHLLAPVTSLGAPLVGIALAVENGIGLTMGLDVLVAVLLMASGPVVAAATGRVAAQRQGDVPQETPQ